VEREGKARDAQRVGVDLVEYVGERHDVAGPLREPYLLAPAYQLDQLTEQDLGLGRWAVPERLHSRLERLHLTVVVGTPDVDEVREAASHLVAVVREVAGEVRGGAVAPHEDAVAGVAERGRTQPR